MQFQIQRSSSNKQFIIYKNITLKQGRSQSNRHRNQFTKTAHKETKNVQSELNKESELKVPVSLDKNNISDKQTDQTNKELEINNPNLKSATQTKPEINQLEIKPQINEQEQNIFDQNELNTKAKRTHTKKQKKKEKQPENLNIQINFEPEQKLKTPEEEIQIHVSEKQVSDINIQIENKQLQIVVPNQQLEDKNESPSDSLNIYITPPKQETTSAKNQQNIFKPFNLQDLFQYFIKQSTVKRIPVIFENKLFVLNNQNNICMFNLNENKKLEIKAQQIFVIDKQLYAQSGTILYTYNQENFIVKSSKPFFLNFILKQSIILSFCDYSLIFNPGKSIQVIKNAKEVFKSVKLTSKYEEITQMAYGFALITCKDKQNCFIWNFLSQNLTQAPFKCIQIKNGQFGPEICGKQFNFDKDELQQNIEYFVNYYNNNQPAQLQIIPQQEITKKITIEADYIPKQQAKVIEINQMNQDVHKLQSIIKFRKIFLNKDQIMKLTSTNQKIMLPIISELDNSEKETINKEVADYIVENSIDFDGLINEDINQENITQQANSVVITINDDEIISIADTGEITQSLQPEEISTTTTTNIVSDFEVYDYGKSEQINLQQLSFVSNAPNNLFVGYTAKYQIIFDQQLRVIDRIPLQSKINIHQYNDFCQYHVLVKQKLYMLSSDMTIYYYDYVSKQTKVFFAATNLVNKTNLPLCSLFSLNNILHLSVGYQVFTFDENMQPQLAYAPKKRTMMRYYNVCDKLFVLVPNQYIAQLSDMFTIQRSVKISTNQIQCFAGGQIVLNEKKPIFANLLSLQLVQKKQKFSFELRNNYFGLKNAPEDLVSYTQKYIKSVFPAVSNISIQTQQQNDENSCFNCLSFIENSIDNEPKEELTDKNVKEFIQKQLQKIKNQIPKQNKVNVPEDIVPEFFQGKI
ncbi:Hypothetical_protein [Hexamita inflata]|uniref:Hypothetical_protein n=1 Tax=Hexamita inflata TaxID=28002 RepID=A0AA86VTR7_9EUKA|nr:Hypothetical protein HINF_LOCUS65403 [Hexamita inflata]